MIGYIGPGVGLSLVGALVAVVAAVGGAIFFVVLWPLRMIMKRRAERQFEEVAKPQQQGRSGADDEHGGASNDANA